MACLCACMRVRAYVDGFWSCGAGLYPTLAWLGGASQVRVRTGRENVRVCVNSMGNEMGHCLNCLF